MASVLKILREEGAGELARAAAKKASHALNLLPCIWKVRRLKATRLAELVDFAFAACGGIMRPNQIRSELLTLLGLVKKSRPKIVMEIGTEAGGTLFLLSRVASKNALIISVDLPAGPYGSGYSQFKIPLYRSFALPGQKMELLRLDSHDKKTLAKVRKILDGREIDVLFIDGDHAYEGVKKDFETYSPLVRRGGIIVFHDIVEHPIKKMCEVSRFWKEAKKGRKTVEIVEDWRQGWAGIGVIRK